MNKEQTPLQEGMLQQQERTLRRSALAAAVEEISSAVSRLMTATYYYVFHDPERLAEFLLPLTYLDPSNQRVRFAVIERERLLARCTSDTQRRVRQSAAAISRKRAEQVQERDLQKLEGRFEKMMREEFQTCGPEIIRSFFDLPDLAAWFKLNTDTAARANYRSTYEALCAACPGLRKLPVSEWSRLCKQATGLRNDSKGHDSPAALDKLLEKNLRESMSCWLEVADLLHSAAVNEAEYQAVYRALERGERNLARPVIPFQALDRPELEHTVIRGALESEGVRCEADCALYDSAQALAGRLDVILTGYRWIGLEEVARLVEEDPSVLTAELAACGLKVERGRVACASVEQAMKLLELRQARQSAEEENRRQVRELEQLRLRLQLSEEQMNQVRRNPQLLQELRRKSGSLWSDLPRLEELAGYERGPLSHGQLQELARTHQLVLDPSVLRSQVGRDFLRNEAVPCLREMRQGGKPAFLVMEATARYHLYQDFEACREAERSGREEERRRLQPAKAAYNFAQDGLYREGLLRYIGVPAPNRRDEEALRLFLRRNSNLRVCVLTCGAVGELVRAVCRQDFPLCAVARVSRAFQDRGGAECRIFPDYLPLADGGQEVDLLDTLRYYDLETELYTAASFGCEPSEETPAAADAQEPAVLAWTEAGGESGAPAFPDGVPLRVSLGEWLPALRRPVRAGDELATEEGDLIRLEDRLREGLEEIEGGEGALYQVSIPDQVAKLYHSDKRTKDREEKLQDMLAHDPGIRNLCWPSHLLYTAQGSFAGYLMPRAPEGALDFRRSVLQLYKNAVQAEVLPGWDRRDLVRAALACARLIARLHANNILMGDMNDGNFMVDPKDSGSVWLVDSDSYQFNGWPCPVGTLDYTHPNTAARLGLEGELRFGAFLRLEEEEDYALAILLFRILLLGQYPFDTRGAVSPAQAMRERRFPYTVEDVADIPEGDNWMIWKNMPKSLTQAFYSTFKEWRTPSAREWAELLERYLYSIDHYGFSRELAPLKYREFNPSKPFYQDVVCELDGVQFNLPFSKFQEIRRHQIQGQRGWHILCKSCWRALDRFKAVPRTLQCDWCGGHFTGNARQEYLKEKLGDAVQCPQCRGRWAGRDMKKGRDVYGQ